MRHLARFSASYAMSSRVLGSKLVHSGYVSQRPRQTERFLEPRSGKLRITKRGASQPVDFASIQLETITFQIKSQQLLLGGVAGSCRQKADVQRMRGVDVGIGERFVTGNLGQFG